MRVGEPLVSASHFCHFLSDFAVNLTRVRMQPVAFFGREHLPEGLDALNNDDVAVRAETEGAP